MRVMCAKTNIAASMEQVVWKVANMSKMMNRACDVLLTEFERHGYKVPRTLMAWVLSTVSKYDPYVL